MPLAAERRKISAEPEALHRRAFDNLTYIRDTMERASTVTAVPGWGGVAMGATAVVAAWGASRQDTPAEWLAVWLAEAVLALGIGGMAAVRKAARAKTPLLTRASKLFAGAFVPPVVAGAILTPILYRHGMTSLLPGVWLLLYGTAVTTAGAFSVRVVPLLGLCLMALGGAALAVAPGFGNLFMAAGFGAAQVVFGLIIARWYGG